ncbi:hypothetical protein EVAR_24587_1 [Eumeta japonica]|uniref:Uncharacterized protein n=1 Tax=Eumeta variegata TaxID=151549 RepID=A0A4C1W5K2_EUMVA|nr:hypothetical protein EVAR_24587_1 [Eumeta japonica]
MMVAERLKATSWYQFPRLQSQGTRVLTTPKAYSTAATVPLSPISEASANLFRHSERDAVSGLELIRQVSRRGVARAVYRNWRVWTVAKFGQLSLLPPRSDEPESVPAAPYRRGRTNVTATYNAA